MYPVGVGLDEVSNFKISSHLVWILVTVNPSIWRRRVNSSELRAVYSRVGDELEKGQGVAVSTSSFVSSVQASIVGGSNSRAMSSEVAGQAPIADDDIRIRSHAVDQSESADLQAFWTLLEHVRVVFPSAVAHIVGETNGKVTLLTLSPSILRSWGARKIYDTLNAGLQSFLPGNDFLSSLSSNENTWVDSLLAEAESKGQDALQIPMFAALLFRLEHAFLEAYQASVATSVSKGAAQPSPQAEEKQSTGPSVDSLLFVNALAKSLKEFDEFEMDNEEKKTITSDFAKACGGAGGIVLADLLVTPLGLVSRSLETGGAGSLAAVDDIIKAALEKLSSTPEKVSKETKDVTPTVPTESLDSPKVTNAPPQDNQSHRGNAKKKKKKKPKRKVRYCCMLNYHPRRVVSLTLFCPTGKGTRGR